jgi:hypothetical protein
MSIAVEDAASLLSSLRSSVRRLVQPHKFNICDLPTVHVILYVGSMSVVSWPRPNR